MFFGFFFHPNSFCIMSNAETEITRKKERERENKGKNEEGWEKECEEGMN